MRESVRPCCNATKLVAWLLSFYIAVSWCTLKMSRWLGLWSISFFANLLALLHFWLQQQMRYHSVYSWYAVKEWASPLNKVNVSLRRQPWLEPLSTFLVARRSRGALLMICTYWISPHCPGRTQAQIRTKPLTKILSQESHLLQGLAMLPQL